MRVRRQFDVLCDAASKRWLPLLLVCTRIGLGGILVMGSFSVFGEEGWSLFMLAMLLIGLCYVLGMGMRLLGLVGGCWFLVLAARTYGVLGPQPFLLPVVLFTLGLSGSGHLFGLDGVLARTRLLERSRLLQLLIGPAL